MSAGDIHVSGLFVYPLKSARGIALDTMTLDERGPRFDRRWMLVDEDGRFISQREVPRLSRVVTSLEDGDLSVSAPGRWPFVVLAPTSSERVPVVVWDDTVDAIPVGEEADAWFAETLGVRCRLVFFPDDGVRVAERAFNPEGRPIGFADGFPLLVVGEASVAELNTRIVARGGSALLMNRFRPNLVVEGAPPYAEDTWREIEVGGDYGVRLAIVKPCARCAITTVDQATGVNGKEPLATLATYRRSARGDVMMGQNAIHDAPGVIRVGDSIRVSS